MDLNFEIFMIVLLVLSILVVGNFLRDGESNWLEGALLVVCRIRSRRYERRLTKAGHIRYYCYRMLVLSQPGCSYFQWTGRL